MSCLEYRRCEQKHLRRFYFRSSWSTWNNGIIIPSIFFIISSVFLFWWTLSFAIIVYIYFIVVDFYSENPAEIICKSNWYDLYNIHIGSIRDLLQEDSTTYFYFRSMNCFRLITCVTCISMKHSYIYRKKSTNKHVNHTHIQLLNHDTCMTYCKMTKNSSNVTIKSGFFFQE